MELKTPKDLKSLAEACRKAGISEFKGFGVEFTLSPVTPKRRRGAKEPVAPELSAFEKDLAKATAQVSKADAMAPKTPTEHEMLFWSSGNGPIPTFDDEDNEVAPQ